MKDKMFKVYTAVVLGNFFWGISNILTRTAISVADPEVLLTCRFVTAFAVLSILMIIRKERVSIHKDTFPALVMMAVTEPMIYFGESYGIKLSNASFASMLTATTPISSIAFAALLLKEYPTLKQILYSLVAVAGVLVITMQGNRMGYVHPLGALILILAVIITGLYRTFNRKAAEGYNSLQRTWSVFMVCSIVFTTTSLIRNHGDFGVYAEACSHPEFVVSFVLLALLSSVAAHVLVNYGYRYLSVLSVSVFAILQNVIGIFAGILVLHEPATPTILIGSAMILISIFMVNRPQHS